MGPELGSNRAPALDRVQKELLGDAQMLCPLAFGSSGCFRLLAASGCWLLPAGGYYYYCYPGGGWAFYYYYYYFYTYLHAFLHMATLLGLPSRRVTEFVGREGGPRWAQIELSRLTVCKKNCSMISMMLKSLKTRIWQL